MWPGVVLQQGSASGSPGSDGGTGTGGGATAFDGLSPKEVEEIIRTGSAKAVVERMQADTRRLCGDCPDDTNGDGNCGKPLCPICGPRMEAAKARVESRRGREFI